VEDVKMKKGSKKQSQKQPAHTPGKQLTLSQQPSGRPGQPKVGQGQVRNGQGQAKGKQSGANVRPLPQKSCSFSEPMSIDTTTSRTAGESTSVTAAQGVGTVGNGDGGSSSSSSAVVYVRGQQQKRKVRVSQCISNTDIDNKIGLKVMYV